MNKQRLEALSDGIFAIVMTLLVIEIRVPELEGYFSERILQEGLLKLVPLFWAYILSFALISSSWITHHFLFTVMAKTVNRWVVILNMLLLSFIALIPFSSNLLGHYPQSMTAVVFYSLNLFAVGAIIPIIRSYLLSSKQGERGGLTDLDVVYAYTRIGVSTVLPLVAILISAFNTYLAISLLILQVLLNLIPGLIAFILRVTWLDKKFLKLVKGDSKAG
jgi:uncharacterized membrane protein